MKVIHKWLSLVLALTMVSYQMQPTTAFAMTDDGISEETATENVEVLNEESSGTITNETEPVVEEEPVVQEQPTVPENTEIVNEEIVEGNNNSEQTTTNVVDDVKEPEEEESKQQQTKNVTNENQLVQEQSEEPSNDEITWTNKGEFPFVTEVKIYNEDGTSIDEDSFDRNQKINLDFYFAIPNDAVVSAGDMYTINIPEGFELVGNLAEQQLDPASGIDVTWELTGNVITVRFYQSLDVISNVSGFMSIGCWFDKDSQLGQDGQDITFVIAGKTYTVDVYYDEITDSQSAEVAKKATYNKDTKEVTWTITVTPDTSHSTLAGVTVEDHYDTSKLDYVEGSFAVNGKSVSDNDVFFNSNGFEYQFPTGLDPGTKTITYKTKVTDEYFLSDSTAVTNNVSTYMPNGDKSSEAEANIQIEKLPMQKEAVSYNAITQTASWKITANRNKLNLKDATIVDEYSEGSYIDTDTIKVNGQKTTNFKVNESKHTLTIYLGDISDVVTITYDMVITDFDQFTKYDDTYYIWNYASLNSGTSVVEEAFGEGWIGVGTENIPIDKGGGVHIDDEYGQYIEWWVDINSSYSSDYKEINDPIVFYDKLPDGLTFMPWGMTITAYFPDGSHAIKYLDAEDVYNPETNEVSYTITPGMDFSGVKATPDCWYAIWFATSIDGVQEGSFTNKASVTVGNQTNSDSHTVDVSYKTEDMIGKSGSYNYEDKTYDWTIVFNKGEQAVLNPVITDTLPEGHAPAREFIYVDNQQVYLNGPAVNGIKATYDPNTNVITVSAEGYRLGKSNIKISTKYVGEGEQGDATNSVALDGDNLSHEFTATSTIKYKPLPVLEKKTNYTQGDTIKWQVVLNLDHDNLGKLSLVDQLSPGLSFDTSSVKLYYANVSSNGTVTATNDQIKINEKDVQYDNTTGLVTIYLPEDLDTHQCYVLEFNTDIQDKSLQTVTNSITFNGTDFQEGTTSDVVILKTTSSSSGIIGEAGTVKIKKLDEITNKPLEGVAFQLLNSNKEPITSAGWAVTNSEGIAEFKDWLRLDTTYYIQEVRTLQGYVYDDTMYEVKVNSKDESKVKEIVVYNTPDAKVNVEGTKTWDDGNNQDGIRPESITVNLLADGEVVDTAEVTAEDNWSYEFNNLPKYAEGKEIVYTVSEGNVKGYEAKVDGYNLTNTHKPETISVEGTKTWDDANNQDGIRPESITVNLLADGEVVDTAEITAEDGWKYSFNELPKYAEGKEIVYTISEEAVNGYEAKVDGFNLTNTHTPETISVEGTKTWDDGNNQDGIRPESITVNLLADGEVVQTIEVTADDNWSYEFNELPKYAEGKEISYTISEEPVEGYKVKVDGYNLINTHTPEDKDDETTTTDDHSDNNTADTGVSTDITQWVTIGIVCLVVIILLTYKKLRTLK